MFVYLGQPIVGKELKWTWGKTNNRCKTWTAVGSRLAEQWFCAAEGEDTPFVTHFQTLWSCLSSWAFPLNHPWHLSSSRTWYLQSSEAVHLCHPNWDICCSSCVCCRLLSHWQVNHFMWLLSSSYERHGKYWACWWLTSLSLGGCSIDIAMDISRVWIIQRTLFIRQHYERFLFNY